MDNFFEGLSGILLVPASIVLFCNPVHAFDGTWVSAARRDWDTCFQSINSVLPKFLLDLRRSSPFANPPTWLLVTMGFTAFCGIGSAAYLMRRKSKERLGSNAGEKYKLDQDGMFKPCCAFLLSCSSPGTYCTTQPHAPSSHII